MSQKEKPLVIEGGLDWIDRVKNRAIIFYAFGVKTLAKTADIVAIPMFWHLGQHFEKNTLNPRTMNASETAHSLQELRIGVSIIIALAGVGLGDQRIFAVGAAFAIGGMLDLVATRAVNRAFLKRFKKST